MRKNLQLAFRNLMRNRRRSLATLLALVIGYAAIVVFGGYTEAIDIDMHTAYVQNGGHLQIQHRDFLDFGSGNPTAYGIDDSEKIIQAITQDAELRPMLHVVMPKLEFRGIAGNYAVGTSHTVLLNGIVPADQNKMRAWNDFSIPFEINPLPLEGKPQDSAIIGNGVARVLQLCEPLQVRDCRKPETKKTSGQDMPDDIADLALGEHESNKEKSSSPTRIDVLASTVSGAPNVASVNVIAAISQGFRELDEVFVTVPIGVAQRLVYGQAKPKATAIVIQLHHSKDLPKFRKRLNELLDEMKLSQPLIVHDFAHLNPFYTQTLAMFDAIFGFIFALIGGIVLFTVSNTMNTSIMERTVEIGTLRAMGLRRSGIRALFVTEGMLIGIVGSLVGVVFALLFSVIINNSGMTWLPPGAAQDIPLHVRVWGEFSMMLFTFVGLVLVSIASAWWPAYRASELKVVDALRHT